MSKVRVSGLEPGRVLRPGSNDFWENTQSLSTTGPNTKDLNKGTVYLQVGRSF